MYHISMEIRCGHLTEVKKRANMLLQYLENKSVMLAISPWPKESLQRAFSWSFGHSHEL